MSESTKLLAEIEAFLADYGVAPSALGREAVGDSAFVKRLREEPGRDMRLSTIDRVRQWMDGQRKSLKHKPKPRKPRSRSQQVCAA